MTPEQTSYVKNVSLIALGGAVVGALAGTYIPKKKTTGNTAFGAVLGAGIAGAVTGFVLRTGPKSPSTQFAGLPGVRGGWNWMFDQAQVRGGSVGCMACGQPAAVGRHNPNWPPPRPFRGLRPRDCIAVGACQG